MQVVPHPEVLGSPYITFLGGTTFSTDQEPHVQGPKVTMSLNVTSLILNTYMVILLEENKILIALC